MNCAFPKWTWVETGDTPRINTALGPCEIAPISSGVHLAFIKIDIGFQAHCCLCGLFSVIIIRWGLIKEGFCQITWKYLHDNTIWYSVCTAGSVPRHDVWLERSRCKILLLPVPRGCVMILALFCTGAVGTVMNEIYKTRNKWCL